MRLSKEIFSMDSNMSVLAVTKKADYGLCKNNKLRIMSLKFLKNRDSYQGSVCNPNLGRWEGTYPLLLALH